MAYSRNKLQELTVFCIYQYLFYYGSDSKPSIGEIIESVFDFRPTNIISELELRKPVFGTTAAYGHFGNPDYAWEKTPKLELVKKYK